MYQVEQHVLPNCDIELSDAMNPVRRAHIRELHAAILGSWHLAPPMHPARAQNHARERRS
jgi:hypothetical protein